MKRENSRFTIDEINKVMENWEQISNFNNGRIEARKRVFSDRTELEKITNYKRKDVVYYSLLFFDIYLPHNLNKIKIATSEVKAPIFTYHFYTQSKFNFSIRNEDLFDKISKYFGQKEVQINNKKFDSKFFIETNQPEQLNEFLDSKISNWLMESKIAYFDFNTSRSENTLTLYCIINEVNKNEINKTISMFRYCIDKLENLNIK